MLQQLGWASGADRALTNDAFAERRVTQRSIRKRIAIAGLRRGKSCSNKHNAAQAANPTYGTGDTLTRATLAATCHSKRQPDQHHALDQFLQGTCGIAGGALQPAHQRTAHTEQGDPGQQQRP